MTPFPILILAFAWLLGWLVVSYAAVMFIKACPEEDGTRDLLRQVEDQLPALVARLLFLWPVTSIRIELSVRRARRQNRLGGRA